MNNTNKIFNTITVSLVVLISIGITGTYLSDYLVSINWFGDYKEIRHTWEKGTPYEYEIWGARHYWYNWGVFFLFITALVRAVIKVVNLIDE